MHFMHMRAFGRKMQYAFRSCCLCVCDRQTHNGLAMKFLVLKGMISSKTLRGQEIDFARISKNATAWRGRQPPPTQITPTNLTTANYYSHSLKFTNILTLLAHCQ